MTKTLLTIAAVCAGIGVACYLLRQSGSAPGGARVGRVSVAGPTTTTETDADRYARRYNAARNLSPDTSARVASDFANSSNTIWEGVLVP